MRRALVLASLLLAAPALADELVVVATHDSQGHDARGAYRGEVEVRPDASYQDRRRYADGELLVEGEVKVVGKGLVFTPRAGAARAFERDDTERKVRWRWSGHGAEQVIVQRKVLEPRLGVVRRLLRRPEGAARWILQNNLGELDPNPQALILRSREPSPGELLRLEGRYGLKTVVSLNGDLDKTARLIAPGEKPREVNLRRFIAELGLRHKVFHMSASRAPSEEELRGVFRILRDDALKPILVHCRGGSDRTGVVGALYAIEFLGQSKERAKATMREHMWAANDGTEIQGAVVDLYQPGTIRRLLGATGRRWF